MKCDADKDRSGEAWADDGEKLLSVAQRAERRSLAEAAAGRDHRRSERDDAPPAGTHYSEKTGHKKRGLAGKKGATSRARFELTGEPDTFLPDDCHAPENLEPIGPVTPEDAAGLQRNAENAERKAKGNWRAHVGSKEKSGLGWNAHRREAAALDAPIEPNPEADAAALGAFQTMVTNGNAPWLAPERPFDPLEGHESAREARKDKHATAAAEEAQGTDGKGPSVKPNRVRNTPDTQGTHPPPTRGRR